MKKQLLIGVLLCSYALSYAGGFQTRLQGIRQNGIGLIGTPLNFGASSTFYNPGSLSKMKNKFEFELGGNAVISNISFQRSNSTYKAETENPLGTPVNFYGAMKVSEKLSVGLGIYTPFGSTIKWQDDWAGNNLIQNISLQSFFFQPTASYKILDNLSIGAGFVIAYGTVDLSKATPLSDDSNVNLKGNDIGLGYNVGITYDPMEKLTIGINYKSQIDMEIDGGDAKFKHPASLVTRIALEDKFTSKLPLPASLDFGVSYKITDKFLVAVEANYVFWDSYKELNFDFEKNTNLNSKNPREYKSTIAYRLGVEYIINEMITTRAGGYFDPSPVNDKYFTPETVSLDTYGYTLGLEINPTEKVFINLSYVGVLGMEEERIYEPESFSGNYKTAGSIFGLGVSYKF